jgi:hypothetical protein
MQWWCPWTGYRLDLALVKPCVDSDSLDEFGEHYRLATSKKRAKKASAAIAAPDPSVCVPTVPKGGATGADE